MNFDAIGLKKSFSFFCFFKCNVCKYLIYLVLGEKSCETVFFFGVVLKNTLKRPSETK